jgi:putative oxidoreductase|tara:strand:+ start:712 stop:1098 length:387 start_codon:yes stop_codon:yes gene_type:complete
MKSLLDLLGRLCISAIFLFSGINKVFHYNSTVQWMEGFGIPELLLIPTIMIEIIFPILIIIGYQTRLAAGILIMFCLVTAFIFHSDFSNQMQLIAFLKNIGLTGGLMFLMANGPQNLILFKKRKYVKL